MAAGKPPIRLMSRQLSPYEKTHLKRFGQTPEQKELKIDTYGQMPVEYMTGRVEFLEYVFHLDKNVLIPRIESEELIELAIEKVRDLSQKKLVLADIGCGCGALGLSLYLELKKRGYQLKLYLSDISASALKIAQKNTERLVGQTSDIKLIESDLLQKFPQPLKFDLILANLPYIPSARIEVLETSVKHYEPHLALDGGPSGLKHIAPFLKQAQNHLKKDGWLLLEVDHTHSKQFLKGQLELEPYNLTVKTDQFDRNRFAIFSLA